MVFDLLQLQDRYDFTFRMLNRLFYLCELYVFFWVPNVIFYLAFLQQVPEKRKESIGEPWEFVGLLPLLDPPRSDSSDTIKHALDLGVNVKMITGTFCIWLSNSTLSTSFRLKGERFRLTCSDNVICR